MSRIVCLGWGSLIWNPEHLPVTGQWNADGPDLPIEFVRKSNNGRVTLVIHPPAKPITTLWSELESATVDEAVTALADREGILRKNAARLIGSWSADAQGSTDQHGIGGWARRKGVEGVVWTALEGNFSGAGGVASSEEVVSYLKSLEAATKAVAEEYVRRAPAQIKTEYRKVIERELGWTPM